MCKPKEKRGLGIRKITNLIRALITKIGWSLDVNHIGWGNIMKVKYLNNLPFVYYFNDNDWPLGSNLEQFD